MSRSIDHSAEFVLAHLGFSDWLKDALATSGSRRPDEVLNDIEILKVIVMRRLATDANSSQLSDGREASRQY